MLYKCILLALQSSLLSPSSLSAPILPANLVPLGPSVWPMGEVYPLEPGGVTSGFTTKASDSPISLNVSANSAAMRGRPEPLFHPCLTHCCPDPVQASTAANSRLQCLCLPRRRHCAALLPIFQLLHSFLPVFHNVPWALEGIVLTSHFRLSSEPLLILSSCAVTRKRGFSD